MAVLVQLHRGVGKVGDKKSGCVLVQLHWGVGNVGHQKGGYLSASALKGGDGVNYHWLISWEQLGNDKNTSTNRKYYRLIFNYLFIFSIVVPTLWQNIQYIVQRLLNKQVKFNKTSLKHCRINFTCKNHWFCHRNVTI